MICAGVCSTHRIAAGTMKFETGDVEEARALLERSLRSLARHKHVAVISKFAQLEYKYDTTLYLSKTKLRRQSQLCFYFSISLCSYKSGRTMVSCLIC